jgi:hypothetical protein
MPPRIEQAASVDWISHRDATRVLGRASGVIYRLAATGQIRTKFEPGMAPRYHRGDCEAIAREAPPPPAGGRDGTAPDRRRRPTAAE